MALSQQLVQKQTQKLILTQELRQSIELLQLSNLELADKIQKELVENPLLEEKQTERSRESEAAVDRLDRAAEEAQRQNDEGDSAWKESHSNDYTLPTTGSSDSGVTDYSSYSSYSDRSDMSGSSGSGSGESDRRREFLEQRPSEESLTDHLIWQLWPLALSREEMVAAELLISTIDRRGFLTISLEELADGDAQLFAKLEQVLPVIYELDPIGCGARDIRESLQIQVRLLRPNDTTSARILTDHFRDLERLEYRKIEREAGLSRDEIEQSLQFIRTLEPFPGSLYVEREPSYVVPDLTVGEQNGEFQIIIDDEWLPELEINPYYKTLLNAPTAPKSGSSATLSGSANATPAADREYLESKYKAASWLIRSIKERRETLYRVMRSIIEQQRDFFIVGPNGLKPMTLREIADQVELHESTISRITTNKYVQTRWGVFELKYFFSSALRSAVGGESHSARAIQERIRIMVQEEGDRPLSDQEIVDRLHKEGVEIARRTVAKYRKILHILPADRRRKISQLQHNGNQEHK